MDTRLALHSLAFAALLIFGCVGKGMPLDLPETPTAPGGNTSAVFLLPQSNVTYAAHYSVEEGDAKTEKTVYRLHDRMRIDVGAEGGTALSIYFTGGKVLSCPRFSGSRCFDVTENFRDGQSALLGSTAMPAGAKYDSETDIGGTNGKCYVAPYNLYGERKVCYTDRGVIAYDEYPISAKTTHVEYATSINYTVSEADFSFLTGK